MGRWSWLLSFRLEIGKVNLFCRYFPISATLKSIQLPFDRIFFTLHQSSTSLNLNFPTRFSFHSRALDCLTSFARELFPYVFFLLVSRSLVSSLFLSYSSVSKPLSSPSQFPNPHLSFLSLSSLAFVSFSLEKKFSFTRS